MTTERTTETSGAGMLQEISRALPGDSATVDSPDLMGYPFFSLGESRRFVPIRYQSLGVTIEVQGSAEPPLRSSPRAMSAPAPRDCFLQGLPRFFSSSAEVIPSRITIGSARRSIGCSRPPYRLPFVSSRAGGGTDSPGSASGKSTRAQKDCPRGSRSRFPIGSTSGSSMEA